MTTQSTRLRDSLMRAGLTPFNPPVADDQAQRRAQEIVATMTDTEQLDLVIGDGFVIRAIERLGLPEIKLFDATQGVHLRESVEPGTNLRTGIVAGHLHRTVSFPGFLNLASSWNRALAAQYARAIGEECRAGGIHVLLGPGVNIYRIAGNGRNFEYAGEDPFLAADMARIFVTALQQTGTMATVKHFIANNSDWCRRLSNSVVGRRALEEIYLPAFRAAVEAGVGAVMTSYNQLNGEYCGEGERVIQGLLRGELGFDGLVMTDWTSVTDGELVASSGQDLEMPYGEMLEAKRDTLTGDPRIRRMAEYVIKACIRMGFYEESWREMPELLELLPEHESVAYRVAAEGVVLLKNEGDVLPALVDDGRTILVTGNWGVRTPISGKGSGYVAGYNHTSFFEAVNDLADGAIVMYRAEPTAEELDAASLVLVFTGFEFEGEGADRDFSLPERQNALIARAAAANPRTVVSIVSGGAIAMPWHDSVAAILYTFFCGQEGAAAVADILFGHTNPSAKLPFTIECDFADSPGADYLPEGGRPEQVQPDGEHPLNRGPEGLDIEWPNDVVYNEGIYVGYRWYAAKEKPVRYWFGHGLSYTSFTYDDLRVTAAPDNTGANGSTESNCVRVVFTVTNSGHVAGAEIAQLYIAPPAGSDRPERELKGYEKVFLMPDETRTVSLCLTESDFSHYDESASAWVVAPGEYGVRIGASYNDIRLQGSVVR
ncbi:MAG: glycosyl hydrolase [Spirochaetaceae bacterium]|nr:MAG: glycosyl hydrolase [Spirochaetaceae bacterium]